MRYLVGGGGSITLLVSDLGTKTLGIPRVKLDALYLYRFIKIHLEMIKRFAPLAYQG